MSFAKILAQVLVQGTAVFGRAFVQAYQNAAANAGKNVAKGAKEAVRQGEMHRAEALEILGVTQEMWKHDREEVEKRYESFSRPTTRTRAEASTCRAKSSARKSFWTWKRRRSWRLPRRRMRRRRRRGAIQAQG